MQKERRMCCAHPNNCRLEASPVRLMWGRTAARRRLPRIRSPQASPEQAAAGRAKRDLADASRATRASMDAKGAIGLIGGAKTDRR